MAQKTPRSRAAVASAVEADETKPRLGKRGQALASLDGVLKKNLRRSANGRKAVSHATIADRAGFYAVSYTHLRPALRRSGRRGVRSSAEGR